MVEREFNLKERYNRFRNNPETIKFMSFIRKYGFIFLILIPIFLSYELRVTSSEIPNADNWARDSVYNMIKGNIRSNLIPQYPNLPGNIMDQRVEDEFIKFKENNEEAINNQIKSTADYFRSRLQDEGGHTYLLAIDPYFWARLSDNVVDHGYPGDYRKEYDWDSYMMAPWGREMTRDNFHAYFQGYLYKFVNIFKKGITTTHVYFYTPILLISLAIIPAFFITRKIGGNMAAFFAAVIVAIHPVILSRTPGGFADTDAYNILFPLLICWMFLLSFEGTRLKKIAFACMTGFLIGLYSKAWGGWYFMLGFVTVTSFAYILFELIRNRSLFKFYKNKDVLNALLEVGILLLATAITLSIVGQASDIYRFLPGFFYFASLHEIQTVWPNVFTTVAEQNEGSIGYAISQLGGSLIFYLAIAGIISTLFLSRRKYGKVDIKYVIILLVWLFLPIWASTRGVRFTLLGAPALAIGFGMMLAMLAILTKRLCKSITINQKWGTIMALLTGVILIGFIPGALFATAQSNMKGQVPSMNDAWYESLRKIDREAPDNSIINSWWDFGHWFKYIGNRPVTFDGTSQNTPNAHWMGKVLLTGDEQQAVGILRMLDCGANNAIDSMVHKMDADVQNIEEGERLERLYDLPAAIAIINKIANEDTSLSEAEEILRNEGISDENIQYILTNSKCDNPPENYFITSEDMIGKSGVWGHFGSWNFDRAQMYRIVKAGNIDSVSYFIDRFGMEETQASNLYNELKIMNSDQANSWISPWPGFNRVYVPCQGEVNGTVQCAEDITIDAVNKTVYLGGGKFKKAVMSINGSLYFEEVEGNNNNLGMFYSQQRKQVLIADPLLVDSIFVRLHFDEGVTTPRFEKFSHQQSFTGVNIYVWRIRW